jgi:hypothetical protein
MGNKFSESSSHIIAYCNVVLAMYHDKVTLNAGGLYWEAPQVIQLCKKCTGAPATNIHLYNMSFKINRDCQNRPPNPQRLIDLFGIASNQESHNDHPPPPPPCRCMPKKLAQCMMTPTFVSPATASSPRKMEPDKSDSNDKDYKYVDSLML